MRVLYKHLKVEGLNVVFAMSHNAKKRHAKKLARKSNRPFVSFTTVWVNTKGRVQY